MRITLALRCQSLLDARKAAVRLVEETVDGVPSDANVTSLSLMSSWSFYFKCMIQFIVKSLNDTGVGVGDH